jgi:spore coat-associated protein N
MKRMKFLFGQRRMQVLLTLAVLLLAASVVIGSGASFTAQKANAGNIFTAGALTMTNDKDPGVVVTLLNMKPGNSISGDVKLENTGTLPGAFTLSKTLVGADAASFGDELQMVVQETAANHTTTIGAPVYTGAASGAISTLSLGTWQPNPDPSQTHYYRITVSWPTTPRVPAVSDDSFQGASVTYAFQWDATSL